jgi:hypothetical protein
MIAPSFFLPQAVQTGGTAANAPEYPHCTPRWHAGTIHWQL